MPGLAGRLAIIRALDDLRRRYNMPLCTQNVNPIDWHGPTPQRSHDLPCSFRWRGHSHTLVRVALPMVRLTRPSLIAAASLGAAFDARGCRACPAPREPMPWQPAWRARRQHLRLQSAARHVVEVEVARRPAVRKPDFIAAAAGHGFVLDNSDGARRSVLPRRAPTEPFAAAAARG